MKFIFPDFEPLPNPRDLLIRIRHRILERAFGVENGEDLPAWYQVNSAFEYMISQANESVIARHWVMMVYIHLEPKRRHQRLPDFRLCIDPAQHFPHSRSPESFLFRKAYRFFNPEPLPLEPIPEFLPFYKDAE